MISNDELVGLKTNVEKLIPNLMEDESSYASLVLDAAAAVSYLLDACLTGNAEAAAYAGECSRNAVDEWIADETALASSSEDFSDRPRSISPHDVITHQSTMDEHPLMVQEMRAQEYALDYLSGHETITILDCEHLREAYANSTTSNIGLH